MLRGRAGLSAAQVHAAPGLDTVTKGVLDHPVVEAATLRLDDRVVEDTFHDGVQTRSRVRLGRGQPGAAPQPPGPARAAPHTGATWFVNLVRQARRVRWTWSGGADSVDLERLSLPLDRRPAASSLTAAGSLLMPAAGSPGLMTSPSSITGSSPARSSGSKSSALARAASVCPTTKRAATL